MNKLNERHPRPSVPERQLLLQGFVAAAQGHLHGLVRGALAEPAHDEAFRILAEER